MPRLNAETKHRGLRRDRRFSPNHRCRFPSCVVAGLRPSLITRAPRLVVRKQPVAQASRLTSSCTSLAYPMVPLAWSPFHRSSAPNIATETQANMTVRQWIGETHLPRKLANPIHGIPNLLQPDGEMLFEREVRVDPDSERLRHASPGISLAAHHSE